MYFSQRRTIIPARICMFKVNNENTKAICEICSKLTIKMPERRYWRLSAGFIANFEQKSIDSSKKLTITEILDVFNTLSLVSTIFHQIFSFSTNDSPSKTEKMFFISSKKLFSFPRCSFYCIFFSSFRLFSRFKRTNGSGIINDAMHWLAYIYRCNFWNNSKTAVYYTTKLGQIIYN